MLGSLIRHLIARPIGIIPIIVNPPGLANRNIVPRYGKTFGLRLKAIGGVGADQLWQTQAYCNVRRGQTGEGEPWGRRWLL